MLIKTGYSEHLLCHKPNMTLMGKYTQENKEHIPKITYYHNYYYTRLTASFSGQPGKAGTRKVEPFWILMKQEMMGWLMAVASAGPYANHLHLTQDRQPCQHIITQVFTDQRLFLPPNQQCQALKAILKKMTTTHYNNFTALWILSGTTR